MRALLYPSRGFVPDALAEQLARSGHELISWGSDEEWAPALAAATAVFHLLHGHEEHARQTVLQLLRRQAGPCCEGVTFVGISTPATWAGATPALGVDGAEQQAAAAAPAPPAALTDRDAPNRRPAPCAAATHALEQLLLSSSRAGVLRCYVVCPGLLYGRGGEEPLLPLFRAAWEGGEPLPLLGPGTNLLPTLHVSNLAAYAEAVATQQPGGSAYLLAADEAPVSTAALVAGLGQLLGQPQARQCSADDEAARTPLGQLLQRHLPFATSPLPQPPGLAARACPGGLLASLPQVLAELRQAHGLAPLRILLRGPPAAGKSHLAARLAALYGLRVISSAAILAELPLMDGDTQKAAAAQLSGKEGHLSHLLMARLAQHLLARLPDASKQGWVLDGWPASLAAARALLCTSSPAAAVTDGLTAEQSERLLAAPSEGGGGWRDSTAGGAAAAKDKKKAAAAAAGSAAISSSGGKEGGSSGSPSGGAGRARRGAGAGTAEDDGGGLDGKARCNPELLPHFVIELDVLEEEALRRVRALVAAEAAAEAAVVATAGPAKAPGSGGGAAAAARKPASAASGVLPPLPRASEADWQRAAEAFRGLQADEAAELAARRAAVLAADMQGSTGAATHHRCDSSASCGSSSSSSAAGPAGGGALPAGAAEVLQVEGCTVQLPEHSTFVSLFVDAGAKYARLSNLYDAGVAAAVPATAAAAALAGEQQQQHCGAPPLPELPALEQQLRLLIGPPRNFRGFPPAADTAAESSCGTVAAAPASADGAAPGAAGGAGGPSTAELLAAVEALSQERRQREAACVAAAAQPLISSLMGSVMTAVMAGLVKVALTRPDDPCKVIADELLGAAAAAQAGYAHPYDDPTYALQEEKLAAKAARDAARAAAAAAKAAREQAAAEQASAAAVCDGSSGSACLAAAAGAGALAGSSAAAPSAAADVALNIISSQASAQPASAAAGEGSHKPATAGRASTVAQVAARGGAKPPAVGAH